MKLKDKVAIITGGGQGLGRAYALRFCKEGAKIVIAEINFKNAKKVEQEIIDMGGEALAIETDVSTEEGTMAMAEKTMERFGKIDILINNASIYYGLESKPLEYLTVDEWDRSYDVNVKGSWLSIKAVAPHMKSTGSGCIINISSGTWLMGIPMLLHYATSKAAILGMVRCVSREFGPFNIRINAITPGFVTTEASKSITGTPPETFDVIKAQTALGRNETEDDVVGTAVFLASEDAAFITGQNIVVDGGWHLY